MKGSTARAIQRLKQSTDFKILMAHLEEDLEKGHDNLMRSVDLQWMQREQGKLLYLNKLIQNINNSAIIAKKVES